jgi:hypothetical protein
LPVAKSVPDHAAVPRGVDVADVKQNATAGLRFAPVLASIETG